MKDSSVMLSWWCLSCDPSLQVSSHHIPPRVCGCARRTVRPGDLAPDDTDLGAADLLLATVDVGNALAVVEGGGLGVVNTLDLDERGVGPDGVLRALERDVLAPVGDILLACHVPLISCIHPLCCAGAASCVAWRWWDIRNSILDSQFLLGYGIFRCGRT